MFALAVVFPLGFAVSAACGRRERALEAYALLEGPASLYFAHRDWTGKTPEGRMEDLRRKKEQ